MFSRDFRRLKRAKTNNFLRGFGVFSVFSETEKGESKETFENKGQNVGKRWAAAAAFLGGCWGLFQDLWGVLEGFRSHSPPA